jgi:hypothetical protein
VRHVLSQCRSIELCDEASARMCNYEQSLRLALHNKRNRCKSHNAARRTEPCASCLTFKDNYQDPQSAEQHAHYTGFDFFQSFKVKFFDPH